MKKQTLIEERQTIVTKEIEITPQEIEMIETGSPQDQAVEIERVLIIRAADITEATELKMREIGEIRSQVEALVLQEVAVLAMTRRERIAEKIMTTDTEEDTMIETMTAAEITSLQVAEIDRSQNSIYLKRVDWQTKDFDRALVDISSKSKSVTRY